MRATAITYPTFFSKPNYQLERRLERLRALRDIYRERLLAIEAEIQELEALLQCAS
jgi:hypothetical protein